MSSFFFYFNDLLITIYAFHILMRMRTPKEHGQPTRSHTLKENSLHLFPPTPTTQPINFPQHLSCGGMMMKSFLPHARMLADMTLWRVHIGNYSSCDLRGAADKSISKCYYWIALAVLWFMVYTVNFLCTTAAGLKQY